MPCLAYLEIDIALAHGHVGLAQTQERGAGDAGDAGIEVGLNLGASLPPLNLVSADVQSETGSQGGETERADLVEVHPVFFMFMLNCKRENLCKQEVSEDKSYHADDYAHLGHVLRLHQTGGSRNGVRRSGDREKHRD